MATKKSRPKRAAIKQAAAPLKRPAKKAAPPRAESNGHACHDPPPPAPRPEGEHPDFTRAELAKRGKPVKMKVSAPATGPTHRYVRADLELLGLQHDGPSYEGRIFLNNGKANRATPTTEENGYAGRFFVFGHGQCFGGAGHCDLPAKYRAEDRRRAHPLEPIAKVITATAAIRRAAAKSTAFTVTIVPVLQAATKGCDVDNVVRFQSLRVVTYNA